MDILHKHGYDMTKAIQDLVPRTGPVLCRDEMEEWSASEANLFEEALDKYGKDFGDVQQDFVSCCLNLIALTYSGAVCRMQWELNFNGTTILSFLYLELTFLLLTIFEEQKMYAYNHQT